MAHKHLGKDFLPADVVAKVTGEAKYAEDFRAEGMVFARLLNSPYPHARVRSIDAKEALAMPGVVGILTPDEVMRIRPPVKEGTGDAERIVGPGEALIFLQGQFVIRGSQLLYFQDPVFRERAAMKPPVRRYTIEGQELVPQRELVVGTTLLTPPELSDEVPPPLDVDESLPAPPDAMPPGSPIPPAA